jgi:trans-aconitate 2-methyltransferase
MNQIDHRYEDWDAQTYHKISNIQLSWGQELLASRQWNGDEIVLDAGCGSGRVTKIISSFVPKGRVYAVDLDQSMISAAKSNLRHVKNIRFVLADISLLELAEEVDVVFSNAVIHWIADHYRLFSNLRKLLKDNGEMLIQCGGKGNLRETHRLLEEVRMKSEFIKYFTNWVTPWNFASEEETLLILEKIGFSHIRTKLTKKIAQFSSSEEYKQFMQTVVMKPYLSYLPTDDNLCIRKAFVDAFLKKKEFQTKFSNESNKWIADYVRLNISALNGSKS